MCHWGCGAEVRSSAIAQSLHLWFVWAVDLIKRGPLYYIDVWRVHLSVARSYTRGESLLDAMLLLQVQAKS